MSLLKSGFIIIFIGLIGAKIAVAEELIHAQALKAAADARRTDLLAPFEAARIEAETQSLFAAAVKLISEAHLNDAKTQLCYAEIDRLRQKMRITEYEFARITAADYKMNEGISFIEQNTNLAKSLILGTATIKTWLGLETLMMRFGNINTMTQVMFEIPVPEIPASQFISNDYGGNTLTFKGGNLGEFYTFAKDNNLSFKRFGIAHKQILRVVSMVCKAADLAIEELRELNQDIRLTIAKMDPGSSKEND